LEVVRNEVGTESCAVNEFGEPFQDGRAVIKRACLDMAGEHFWVLKSEVVIADVLDGYGVLG
jgi:hypothetical protein